MCLVLQDSRVCAFLWLKAAIVSNCCVKNTINLICHGASHFELAALILFFYGMSGAFLLQWKNIIGNKSFIKLNIRPQSKLWRSRSCLRGMSQDLLQRSFNPISHPSTSTHFTQGTKNWHLQRNSRSLSILLAKGNPRLLGLISHDDSSFFHVEPRTSCCKYLKR